MRKSFEFHGPMTPDGAPPVATRHLCYGGLLGGGTPAPRAQMLLPPEQPKPIVIPQADPLAQRAEAGKRLALARSRTTTRASTILGDEDLLGG